MKLIDLPKPYMSATLAQPPIICCNYIIFLAVYSIVTCHINARREYKKIRILLPLNWQTV